MGYAHPSLLPLFTSMIVNNNNNINSNYNILNRVLLVFAGCNSSNWPRSWRIRVAGTWTYGGPCRLAQAAPPAPSRASAWAPRRRARRLCHCHRFSSSRCRPRHWWPWTRPASGSPTRRRARYRNRWRSTGRSRDTVRLTRRSPPAGDASFSTPAAQTIATRFNRRHRSILHHRCNCITCRTLYNIIC